MADDTDDTESNTVPRLQLSALNKRFAGARGEVIHALRDVSLEVADGELLAIVGPSASGKTTLLRVIAGLETPDSGTVVAEVRELTHLPPQAREVAMVFQSLALYPHLTARDNIGFGLRLRGLPPGDRSTRVNKLAGRLGIASVLDRHPADLSAGQRQRVALARALAQRPRILLLDEPFSHLDRPLRRELCGELRVLHRELALTTLLVTHDTREAEGLAGRAALLHDGRLEQVGRFEDLRASPATAFVASFMGEG
jgi:ABC-type sugar transport system ATPase subunit